LKLVNDFILGLKSIKSINKGNMMTGQKKSNLNMIKIENIVCQFRLEFKLNNQLTNI